MALCVARSPADGRTDGRAEKKPRKRQDLKDMPKFWHILFHSAGLKVTVGLVHIYVLLGPPTARRRRFLHDVRLACSLGHFHVVRLASASERVSGERPFERTHGRQARAYVASKGLARSAAQPLA